jgi:lysophospholipase L1-like esterase
MTFNLGYNNNHITNSSRDVNEIVEVPGNRVVFFGDSITEFWRLDEYFPGEDYINRGIRGQVTKEMLDRFKTDVLDLTPATVVILAGTNDLAYRVPLNKIVSNIATMAKLAHDNKIRVILASILPVNDCNRYQNTVFRPPIVIKHLNEWIKFYCAKNGFTYLDYHSHMIDEDGLLRNEFSADGLHPNDSGYQVMDLFVREAINDK